MIKTPALQGAQEQVVACPADRSGAPVPTRNLDFLRATAVLLVACDHLFFNGLRWFGTSTMFLLAIGRLGVMLFFVHTSLVLMLSLNRTNGNGWELIRSFYLRRVFRIYPLSMVTVIAVASVGIPFIPFQPFRPIPAFELLSNLALIQNLTRAGDVIGPLWSLPWEVQMYVVLPFVFLGLRAGKARLVGVLALCIVLVNVVGVGTGHRVFRIFDFVPCFMAGILSFVRLSWPKGRIPAFFWPLALILLVIAYAASGLGWPLRRIYVADWIACTIVGLLIPQFQDLPNNFVTAAAHQVAKYSYGIYLFHLPVIWLSFDCLAGIGTAASVLLFLIATAVLSIAGYHLIEEPMIRAGKRFAN